MSLHLPILLSPRWNWSTERCSDYLIDEIIHLAVGKGIREAVPQMALQHHSTRLHERSLDGSKLVQNRKAVPPLICHSCYCVQVSPRRVQSYHHVMVHGHSPPLNDRLMIAASQFCTLSGPPS